MKSTDESSKCLGLLDTNVVIHSFMNDAHSEECRAFLASLESGERRVCLEPYVMHEITYVLARHLKLSKEDIAAILLRIILWPGVDCERELLSRALINWRERPGMSFVDALLASKAIGDKTRVFTINVKDFDGMGIDVPVPLANF